ncbi:MAG: hypothetical protein EOP83_10445 [Verrucomicrobiaceae bacterium]|nr:MAG: hypothetical protein EOP83_10445 [Verrucomicrobiaceae bacterium]
MRTNETNVTPAEFRRAVYPTFCLSLMVLFLPAYGESLGNLLEVIMSYPIQIAMGCSVMILVIECVGIPLRAGLNHFGAGILFAFFLYLSGVVSVSAAAMLVDGNFDLWIYLYYVLFFGICGVLPASVFGLIGTAMLRSNTRTLPSDVPRRTRPTGIPHFKP